jgi:hypothetical protein
MSWVSIGVGVAGAVGSYAASSASSGGSAPTGSGYGSQPAPPRDIGAEFGQMPSEEYLQMLADYETQAGQRQLMQDYDRAQMALGLLPQITAAERQATKLQRRGDLNDFRRFSGPFGSALENAAPEWGAAKDALGREIGSVGDRTALDYRLNMDALGAGPSALRTELEQQALDDLRLGRALSPDALRDVTQATREGFADRGMINSNPAMFAEVLNRDRYAGARQGERRQFASGVQQLGVGEDAANRGFQTSVQGMNEARLANQRGFLTNATQVSQGTLQPLMNFFQRSAVPVTAGAAISSGPSIIGSGSQAMSPLLNYSSNLFGGNFDAAQGLYSMNFNANQANRIAAANNTAALLGAGIGAAGQIGSAYYTSRPVTGTGY